MRYLAVEFGFCSSKCQRLVEAGDIFFGELVGLLARIIQKVGDDLIQPLGFPAYDTNQVPLVLLQEAPIGPIPLPPPPSRIAAGGFRSRSPRTSGPWRPCVPWSPFPFQAVQIGEVLKVKHVAGGAPLCGAQGRNRYSDEALLSVGGQEIHLAALRQLTVLGRLSGQPEVRPKACSNISANGVETGIR